MNIGRLTTNTVN